ncbi:hypothetical protein [Microvirga calopogonii]|uniref:hypothetical protein n=1 Tax=Microvirga calopogonii TaxID=2078013 RepID=UPI000E0D6EC7|nr:hypothetical protein [Microvirga calopogonii]
MGTVLWFLWFLISRKVTYLTIFGLWAFSGLFCLVGAPGWPTPPDIWVLYWLLGTFAMIPALIWYTRYNIAVFVRMTARGSRQAAGFIETEWRKG